MTPDTSRWRHILNVTVGLGIILGIFVWVGSECWPVLISIHAAILVVGLTIGGLWLSFGPQPILGAVRTVLSTDRVVIREAYAIYILVFARAYRLALSSGIVATLIGIMIVLSTLDDPAYIGKSFAVSLTGLLYGVSLAEFLFRPLQQVLKSRAVMWELNLPPPM
jgi:hypothetical protein